MQKFAKHVGVNNVNPNAEVCQTCWSQQCYSTPWCSLLAYGTSNIIVINIRAMFIIQNAKWTYLSVKRYKWNSWGNALTIHNGKWGLYIEHMCCNGEKLWDSCQPICHGSLFPRRIIKLLVIHKVWLYIYDSMVVYDSTSFKGKYSITVIQEICATPANELMWWVFFLPANKRPVRSVNKECNNH